MATIINVHNNHVVMSGISQPGRLAEKFDGESNILRMIDEDVLGRPSEKKVIMHDNYDRDNVSDILFASTCWATKEEWDEFDRLVNLDGALWYYMEVSSDTPLYDASSVY